MNYIIGIEQPNNQILFQGRAAKLVQQSKDALPFINPPVLFVKNLRANGLQPIVFRGFDTNERTIVDIN